MALKQITIPSGIERIPKNLGSVSHGELKASQWHSLFAICLPLAIMDLLILDINDFKESSTRCLILNNVCDFIQCTNIVSSKAVTEKDSERFKRLYDYYGLSSKALFKDIRITPNHHYALHIPDQLRYWGPLMGLSKFAGERMNGILQKVKTNQHLGKFS